MDDPEHPENEDDADTEHLPTDDNIPTRLPMDWRERLSNPAEIAKIYGEVKENEQEADEKKYASMLDSFRVAAAVWVQCSRLHSDAKTPADRAAVKADYLKIGEQIGGVKKARWLERRRLGFMLPEIHKRTLAEQEHQAENGQSPMFPSFNTVSRRWFPSKGASQQLLAAERKAASDALEREYANASEDEKRVQLMEAADRATEAEQKAARLMEDLAWERSAREATEKRHEGELAALREALAEREAEIERLRTPPITPDDPPPIAPDPPITPDDPRITPDDPPITPDDPPITPDDPPIMPEDRPVTPEDRPVTPEDRPVTPEDPPVTPEGEADSWADLDVVRASKLKARALVASDFPDLNAKLDVEDAELGITRKRQMVDATMELATRRLRVVAVRCAQLTGAPDKAGLLAAKGKKWFVGLIAKPVGEVIAAVGGSPAEAEE